MTSIPANTQWPDLPVYDYYHFYSDGHRKEGLFESDEDHIYAMNLIAILAHDCAISVLCLNILDTHLHCLLRGMQSGIHRFKTIYPRLLNIYFTKTGRNISPIITDLRPIKTRKDLLNCFVYVYRNCNGAGFPLLPSAYRWGPGELYFVPDSKIPLIGNKVHDLSQNKCRQLFRTELEVPSDWLYDDSGLILPQCYVDYKEVNRFFRTVNTYLGFMHISRADKDNINEECNRRLIEDLSDKDLRRLVSGKCLELLGKALKDLSLQEKIKVARTIWESRAGYSRRQLARALKVGNDVLDAILA